MQPSQVHKLANFSHTIDLCPKALQALRAIKGQVYPVCIMGPAVSGKSALLNEVIGEQIFEVGKTTNGLTKGLWVYPRHMPALDCTILFIDSQGFDNAYGSDADEASLMLMMLLISKMVLHNTFGPLDSKVVSRLAMMAEKLPKNVGKNPCLAFIQRDFSLQMVDADGNRIDAEDYLEYSFKNLKDKRTINILKQGFTNKPENISSICSHKQELSCILLPCSNEKARYQSGLQKLKAQIVGNMRNRDNLVSIKDFVLGLEQACNILNSSQKFDKIRLFHETVKQKNQKQEQIEFSAYKSHLGQKLKQFDSKEQIPVPKSLLAYKIQAIYTQYFQNDKFLLQLISKKKLQDFNEKMKRKLQVENQEKIEQFVSHKSLEYFDRKLFSQEKIDKFIEQMLEGYAFLEKQRHLFLLQKEYWKNYCQNIKKETLKKGQRFKQTQNKKQKEIMNFQIQINQYKAELEALKSEIIELKNECKCQQELVQQMKQNDQFVKQKLKDYHSQIQKSKAKQIDLCLKIQQKLRNSLNYEDYSSMKEQTRASNLHTEKLIRYLQDLSNSIKTKDTHNTDTILSQQERIIQLENMNKMLRVKIQEAQVKGSQTTIQYQYKELSHQYNQFERETFNRINTKDQMICELSRKLQKSERCNIDLTQQLQILRSSLKDRHKGTQFLQKIIENKDKNLESLRNQLMDTMSKYRREITDTQAKHRTQNAETNQTLSMFIIKNEQLQSKVNELENKLQTTETKHKITITDTKQEKNKQIEKLQREIREIELSIQSATESYTEVTEKMQKIILEKQQALQNVVSEMQSLKRERERYKQQIQNVQQKNDGFKSMIARLQLQKEQIQNKLKRQETLHENKIRHLSNQNDKLKVQLKEKCSTFEIMLLQLRGENILKEGGCRDSETTSVQLSKLNKLEEQVLKELNLLSINQDHSVIEEEKTFQNSKILKAKDRNQHKSSSKSKYQRANKQVQAKRSRMMMEGEQNYEQKYLTGQKKQSKNNSSTLSLFNSNNHKHFKSSFSDGKNLIKGVNLYENFNRSTNVESLFYNMDRY